MIDTINALGFPQAGRAIAFTDVSAEPVQEIIVILSGPDAGRFFVDLAR